MKKHILVLQVLVIALSFCFTLLNLSFYADISALAFLPSLIFSLLLAYLGIVLFSQRKSLPLSVIRKLYEYTPFVLLLTFILRRAGNNDTSYALDLIAVLVWVAVTIFQMFLCI